MKALKALIISAAVAAAISGAQAADLLVLITAQEAALPSQPAGELNRRGITRGPQILMVSPAANAAVVSPVHWQVKFEAHGGAKINPDTVKVTYLKEPAVDLTGRVKPFTQGTGIDIDEAQLPPGQHLIRVDVTDSDGRISTALLTLKVGP